MRRNLPLILCAVIMAAICFAACFSPADDGKIDIDQGVYDKLPCTVDVTMPHGFGGTIKLGYVDETAKAEALDAVKSAFFIENGAATYAVVISLVKDGKTVGTDEPITVGIELRSAALPLDRYVVYHVHDGKADLIEPAVSGNKLTFAVTDFSVFVVAPRHTHTVGEPIVVTDATCETAGLIRTECTVCHEMLSEEIVEATDHDYKFNSFAWEGFTAQIRYVCSHDPEHVLIHAAIVTDEITTEATCENAGVRTYTATYDGYTDEKTEAIEPLGHDYEFDSFVWSEDGAQAKYVCSRDPSHTENHTATVTEEITAEANCENAGESVYTATYDEHTEEKAETTDPLGHDYEFDSFVWSGNGAQAKYVCSRDPSHTENRAAKVTSAVTTEATCESAGVRTYTATYDGHTEEKTEAIDPLGHDYKFDSFVWNGSAAQAKYVCSNDPFHVDYHDATVSSVVTTEATCEEDGVITYTATYERTEERTEAIPALGHVFVFDSFVWDGFTAEAEYICERDHSHVEYNVATVTSEITVQPTCETAGERTYTATYDEHTDEKSVVIDPIGHEFGGWRVTTPASCNENGVETRYCLHDGTHTESREIEATGEHEASQWLVNGETGVEFRECTVCHEVLETR